MTLSALLVLVACTTDDGDGWGDWGTSATVSSGGDEDPADTEPDEEADDGAGTSDDGGADTAADSSTTGSTEPPASCGSYCSTEAACGLLGLGQQECVEDCARTFADWEHIDSTCLVDYEALLVCIAGLTCPDLERYYASRGQPMETGYPCRQQDIQVVITCQ